MEMPTAARRTIPADVQGKVVVQELESDTGVLTSMIRLTHNLIRGTEQYDKMK